MWLQFCLLGWFLLVESKLFDDRVITAVRKGIDKNLEYINEHYKEVNVDCLLGVVLTTAVLRDAYQNGTQIMDNSSMKLIHKSVAILEKSLPLVDDGNRWIASSILDYRIWEKDIIYKQNQLYELSTKPNFQYLENIFKYQTFSNRHQPDTDYCLQDIVNLTATLLPQKCFIDEYCWDTFDETDKYATGYILTHKLLFLQLAKARKCEIEKDEYEKKVKQLCSLIFAEVFNGDYYGYLDYIFDLFLEEIFVCGYEGYTEFFKNKWLYYILKNQRTSGCFPAILGDDMKTRIRRNTNILKDGCADHTTGLGAAVLSLYYDNIIKENMML